MDEEYRDAIQAVAKELYEEDLQHPLTIILSVAAQQLALDGSILEAVGISPLMADRLATDLGDQARQVGFGSAAESMLRHALLKMIDAEEAQWEVRIPIRGLPRPITVNIHAEHPDDGLGFSFTAPAPPTARAN